MARADDSEVNEPATGDAEAAGSGASARVASGVSSDVPEDPRAGDVLGRIVGGNFRVVRQIGAGAMGNVYQAEQLSLGKMVALKLLRSEFMGDERLIRRFELEARNASSLNHPNSIQIIDFGRDRELLFIAMELLSGVDLQQLIARDGPLPLPRVGRIMDQVLAALDEAHAAGIVHRDLKPGNIMLVPRRGEPDFVKVCDFGIAKGQTAPDGPNLTMKGLVCGTPEYMSPEQARGEPVDGRSDLYAVAVILYQLVAGEIPFSASSPVGILSRHLTDAPVPPSRRRPSVPLPPALEALILKGLAKAPQERPRTAAEFRQALRAALVDLVDEWPSSASAPPATLPVVSAVPAGRVASAGATTLPASDSGAPVPPVVAGSATRAGGSPRAGRVVGLLLGTLVVGAIGVFGWNERRSAAPPALAPARPAPPSSSPPLAGGPIEEAPAKAAERGDPAADRPASPDLEEPAPETAGSAAPGGRPSAPRPSSRPRPPRARREVAARRPEAPPPAETIAALAPPPPAAPAVAPTPPLPPSPPDLVKEAERLLGQGDVGAACKKAEEARRMTPKLPVVHKLLGKCYMRAGSPQRANEAYRRYLELAPDASDAAFIRSIVR